MSIFREFLRHPLATGALAASSRHLAQVMTADIGLERAEVVLELGPGTGAFTDAILPRLAPGAKLIAVELNPTLARRLAHRYRDQPVTVLRGSAAQLHRFLPGPVDVVVSGLPWTTMSDRQRSRILTSVDSVVTDGARFTTFAYVHAAWTRPARRFTEQLAARFAVLDRSRVVWPNFPPAFVHRAAVPRRAADHSESSLRRISSASG